jgi:hypothetical protein
VSRQRVPDDYDPTVELWAGAAALLLGVALFATRWLGRRR